MTDQPLPPYAQLPASPAKPYLERRPAIIPLLVAALLALIGAGNLPYDYYTFLRCALTITGVFLIVHTIRSQRYGWLALGIPVVILWAPAVLVPLPTSVWKVLDVIVAAVLIVAGLLISGPDGNREDGSRRWEWWKIALLVFGIGVLASGATVYAPGDRGCVKQYDNRGSWCD